MLYSAWLDSEVAFKTEGMVEYFFKGLTVLVPWAEGLWCTEQLHKQREVDQRIPQELLGI